MPQTQQQLNGVAWCDNPYDAMVTAVALVLVTEWHEYRNLNLARVRQLLSEPVVVDLRNMYLSEDLAAAGLKHTGIGRGAAPRRVAGPEPARTPSPAGKNSR